MKFDIEDELFEIKFNEFNKDELNITVCKLYKIINDKRLACYLDSKYKLELSKKVKEQIRKYLDNNNPDIFSFSVELKDLLVYRTYEFFLRHLTYDYNRYNYAFTTDEENIRFLVLAKTDNVSDDILNFIKN